MSDKLAPQSLEELFDAFVMGDEESHEHYQEILKSYGLVEEAMNMRFEEESLLELCQETRVLLEYLADSNNDIEKASADAVRQSFASIQLLLTENASPDDVNLPRFEAPEDGGSGSDQDGPSRTIESDEGQVGELRAGQEVESPSLVEDTTTPDERVVEEQSEAAAVDTNPLELSAFLADAEMAADFIGESVEHIEQVDVQLLTLDQDSTDAEALNAVFRAFHTIKGLSGFFGLSHVQEFAHVAETLLDLARDGKISLEGHYLDLTFDANECLKNSISTLQGALENGNDVYADEKMHQVGKALESALAAIDSNQAIAPSDDEVVQPLSVDASVETTEVSEAPDSDPVVEDVIELMESPNPEVKVAEPAPPVEEKAPEAKVETQSPDVKPQSQASEKPEREAKNGNSGKGKTIVRETIRVDAGRLDLLMDSVGELVIAESILAESDELKGLQSSKLESLLCHMDKITRELQEMAMSLRMMPIRPTFQKMARLARDLSKKLNRRVHFVTTGDDTELDKSVVDSLGDPLVHMVRNAIDHGLEKTVEERRAANKPDSGNVELRAFHQGGNIVIEIEDDGRGMKRDAILNKAIQNGIVESGDGMSDSDVYSLIFEPGFSTAEKLTDVSGRGVGLDVVKRGIEALRGTVEVSSEEGQGTVFTLRLPLTLAIIEGMVVRVGSQKYIVPTLCIVRMQKFESESVSTVLESGHLLRVGDDLVPLYRLADVFDVDDDHDSGKNQSVVIVEGNKRQYAFVVDELIGQQQIVIKGLGQVMGGTRGLSGGAIMADGRVGLILDIGSLVRLAESIETTTDFATKELIDVGQIPQ